MRAWDPDGAETGMEMFNEQINKKEGYPCNRNWGKVENPKSHMKIVLQQHLTSDYNQNSTAGNGSNYKSGAVLLGF